MSDRVRQSKPDEGAMLIIALIVITVVAVVTGALLALGNTNFAATVALRQVASNGYAADAAAKTAVNYIENGFDDTGKPATYNGAPLPNTPNGWVYDNNTDGTGCFGKHKDSSGNPQPTGTVTLPSVYANSQSQTTETATVVCTPVPGTGLFAVCSGCSHQPPPSTDPFSRALTTDGTNSTVVPDGMALKPLGSGGNAVMPFRGDVESKTSIAASNGVVETNGSIKANSVAQCTTSGGGSFSPACTAGWVDYTPPADPLTALPTYRDPSTEGCTFQPGFYNNGAALSAAVNSCTSTGAHFVSGLYYFDFADGNPWDIKVKVVAGQLTTDMTHTIPGACVSPIGSTGTTGVQFVFGNTSNVTLENGAQVEICGPTNSGNAPMTMFQQPTGATSSPTTATCGIAPSTSCTVIAANGAGGAGTQPFTVSPTTSTDTLSQAVAAKDSVVALWAAKTSKDTGELDLSSFAGMSSIPAGSTINSVKLGVNYTPNLSSNATFVAGVSGQATTTTIGAPGSSGWSPDVDLTSQVVAQIGTGGFTSSSPTIRLLVGGSTGKKDTLSVDAVRLTVNYTPPSLRAAVLGNFITTPANFAGQFVVQGSTYAPNGEVTLLPGNNSSSLVALRWGLVAWGVSFQSQPQQVFGYPLVSIPDLGPGLGNSVSAVDLKVFLCTGAGPCATSGTPSLTARVQYTDYVCPTVSSSPYNCQVAGEVSPIPGGRQVNVLSWAEQK